MSAAASGVSLPRFVCIHAHLYQPPRENPWTGAIEVQDSAHPYHDWNERIAAECYAPNGWARLLDARGRIRRIANNYARVSFNAGPTLLSWLEVHDPATYERILEGDRQGAVERGGHGNAIAQPYVHMILPLASRRDKVTQVRWGIADFVHRFRREPEGMWLPETAVDTETLEVLAEHAIRFTILSPAQAARIRPLEPAARGGASGPAPSRERPGATPHEAAAPAAWRDVSGARVDPSMAYRLRLPSGRAIDVFFYDGPISHAVAFGGILSDGETFARKILGGFSAERTWPQLVHLATDGESYGHHHRFGEMALAFALDRTEASGEAALTNYGLFLERHPPAHEVQIHEPTSWSCAHGVERWRSDCGCSVGTHPGWNQRWRAVLREALDWLRDETDTLFEGAGGRIFVDPWAARDAYVTVLLDPGRPAIGPWLASTARPGLGAEQGVLAARLLEMQRQRMLAHTSCGWFFDDISGIETVQCLRHAARALQLARAVGADLEGEFVRRLSHARSNLAELGDGAGVWARLARPAIVDLDRVVAHHALTASVGDGEGARPRTIHCFRVEEKASKRESYGESSLSVGRVEVRSEVTFESARAVYGVLHFGGHDFHCAVAPDPGEERYARIERDLLDAFGRHTLTEVVRSLDRSLGTRFYTLKDLFLDERRRVIGRIVAQDLERLEGTYRLLYEENRRLMEYLRDSDVPLPRGFLVSAEFVLARDLEAAVGALAAEGTLDRVKEIVEEAKRWWIQLDPRAIERSLGRAIEDRVSRLFEPESITAPDRAIREFEALLDAARVTGAKPDLWRAQNVFHAHWLRLSPGVEAASALRGIGEKLGFGPVILGE